jgi:1,4-alpha-glucan branching enzyme
MTGMAQDLFSNAKLMGSWDASGLMSANWSAVPMTATTGEDGCPAFVATASIDASQAGQAFSWGVIADAPSNPAAWVIPYEVNDPDSSDRTRSFVLQAAAGIQDVRAYYSWSRRLGAQKYFFPQGAAPGARFSAYAPYARNVEVVFGLPATGYIDDSGGGIDPDTAPLPMTRGPDGVWDSDPSAMDFATALGRPYMFRVTTDAGAAAYRTDLYSRRQIGMGAIDPNGAPTTAPASQIDGSVSCGVVVDPDTVAASRGAAGPGVSPDSFWRDEFRAGFPMPTDKDDLVIYELFVGSLGFGKAAPGDLDDAIAFLDHLSLLGVNAVELLPMAQSDGSLQWGYGDTHHFAIESAAGGRDDYKRFVRACHRRGIAVIQDVVYNHFDAQASRAEWAYDSALAQNNTYYWYQGTPPVGGDPNGGYLDNGSSGWSPRFWDEKVRAMFVSAAVALVQEFHVDGFRADLTNAIHSDQVLHADGTACEPANQFGAKFLREWSRAVNLVNPDVFLFAEDYSGDPAVALPTSQGGLGFDAVWYADFIHHLVGDGNYGSSYARLVHNAGLGGDGGLAMDYFGDALLASADAKVVYNEIHDEVGNEANTRRTIVEAVNGAPLVGETRWYAEARCRFAFGSLLGSAGTPIFFMAEEVGSQNNFPLDSAGILAAREDIVGEASTTGANLFAFYKAMIAFRRAHASLRGGAIAVVHVHDDNRVIAWTRQSAAEELLIVASLNNAPFASGYGLACDPALLPDGAWQEVFNSDSAAYGGDNFGNAGATLDSAGGFLSLVVPACGLVVLARS